MVVDCLSCGASGSGTECSSCGAPLWHPDDTGAHAPTSPTVSLPRGAAPPDGRREEAEPPPAPPVRVRQATRGMEPRPRERVRFGEGEVPSSLLRQEPARVGLTVLVMCCLAAGLAGFALRGPLGWSPREGEEPVRRGLVGAEPGTPVPEPGTPVAEPPAPAMAVAPANIAPSVAYARGGVHVALAAARDAQAREQRRREADAARARQLTAMAVPTARSALAEARARAAEQAALTLARRWEERAEDALRALRETRAAQTPEPAVAEVAADAPSTVLPVPASAVPAPAPAPLPSGALTAVGEGAQAGTERALAQATRLRDTRIALDDALEALQCDRAQRLERELGELSPAARASYRDALDECHEARDRRRGLPPRTLE